MLQLLLLWQSKNNFISSILRNLAYLFVNKDNITINLQSDAKSESWWLVGVTRDQIFPFDGKNCRVWRHNGDAGIGNQRINIKPINYLEKLVNCTVNFASVKPDLTDISE